MAITRVIRAAVNAAKNGLVNEIVVKLNGGRNVVLSSPGLRIVGGSASALAEAQTAFYAIVQGTLVSKAAGVDMPALSGTVTADNFGIFVWTMNSAGTITQRTLAQATTLAGITFPAIPDNEAVVGMLLVNPTGTGNFVGGTTVLDDATVVPNAVFFNGSAFGGALTDLIAFKGEEDLPST